jgi:hypothetical protein
MEISDSSNFPSSKTFPAILMFPMYASAFPLDINKEIKIINLNVNSSNIINNSNTNTISKGKEINLIKKLHDIDNKLDKADIINYIEEEIETDVDEDIDNEKESIDKLKTVFSEDIDKDIENVMNELINVLSNIKINVEKTDLISNIININKVGEVKKRFNKEINNKIDVNEISKGKEMNLHKSVVEVVDKDTISSKVKGIVPINKNNDLVKRKSFRMEEKKNSINLCYGKHR